MKKVIVVVVLGLGTLALLAGCAGAPSVPPGERVFYINAIEIKGGTSVDKLAPP